MNYESLFRNDDCALPFYCFLRFVLSFGGNFAGAPRRPFGAQRLNRIRDWMIRPILQMEYQFATCTLCRLFSKASSVIEIPMFCNLVDVGGFTS